MRCLCSRRRRIQLRRAVPVSFHIRRTLFVFHDPGRSKVELVRTATDFAISHLGLGYSGTYCNHARHSLSRARVLPVAMPPGTVHGLHT